MRLGLVLLMAFSIPSFARVAENGLPNFHEVTQNIYRSGRPASGGLQYLKDSKFKLVINLENNEGAVRSELNEAARVGIEEWVSMMEYFKPPTDAQVNEILAKLQDPRNFPILLHCHHGKDRTGMIMALYRVEVQGWDPEKAYKEMLDLGFSKFLVALDRYYRARTGMHGGPLEDSGGDSLLSLRPPNRACARGA